MADAAVEFLLNNLKELLVDHHSHLIRDTPRGHIESLQRDLQVFNAFLRDSVEKRRAADERTKLAVQEIREVVYEVEDIIDTFVNKIMAEKSGTLLSLMRTSLDLHTVDQEAGRVRQRVEQARIDAGIVSHKDELKPQQSQDWLPERKDVVGFKDEIAELIDLLTRETEYLDVISLVGMLGQGKTTLAWKVYNDQYIMYNFPIRIWLSISQELSDRDIFLSILKELTTITEVIKSKKDHEIADLVIAHLDRGSFLIVLDDVWETAQWQRLNAVLPRNSKGKVMITTRNEDVANFASRPKSIKRLRFFTEQESWELLRLEALDTLDCPPDLEIVGKMIAKDCEGLPLAIAIIGDILATKFGFRDISATEKEWEKVSTRVSTFLNEYDPEKRMKKSIYLSYDTLPFHLRSCFLYLAMFPKNYEIPASKLIRMWIGEGFIQHRESCSLEEAGEKYLEELIKRNLVRGEKFKHDGKVKTCRISAILRDFCCAEAENENFFKEIKVTSDGVLTPPIPNMDRYRRLSMHSNFLKFISSKPSCPRVRSFVYFSNYKFVVSEQDSSKIFAAFKFLKVLDVEPIEFTKIGFNLYRLFYMRYLALSCNLSVLHLKFSQLWNIQTIIVSTTSRTLEVKDDIWNMIKLRYFKTNAIAILPKPSKSSKYGKELCTLGTISVESCTPELFNQASNLKKLGIRGNLSLLLDGNSGAFNSLGKMDSIEKLKLINDVYPFPSSEKPLHGLPQHHQFPSGLMSLTLRATFLSWDAMSILGLLKKLEVLKLRDHAFTGSVWEAVDGGFQCLELLDIEETDLVHWHATSFHYPKLKGLVLRNCENLLAIPIGMADIPSLQTLDLYSCKSASASARDIKEVKKKIKEVKKMIQAEGSTFMLTVSPPMSDQS